MEDKFDFEKHFDILIQFNEINDFDLSQKLLNFQKIIRFFFEIKDNTKDISDFIINFLSKANSKTVHY